MKTRLHPWLIAFAFLPLGAWAQNNQQRETVDATAKLSELSPANAAKFAAAQQAAAGCAVTTSLDFAARPVDEDWKNHAAVVVGAAPRNTTISTAGTYVEPAGGAETTLTVENTTTQNLGVQNLFWFTNYTNTANSTTQITYYFNRPVNSFAIKILDLDRNTSNFIDAVTFDAYQANGVLLDMNSSADATTALADPTYTSRTNNTITGIKQSTDGQATGDVTVTFNKPITRFTITYQNLYPIADPGVQYIGIASMTWCTQANVATTLSGPARALPASQVTYTVTTTASGDYAATGVQPTVQLSAGLNSQSPVFPAGSTYDNATGKLTLAPIATLAVGASSTSVIKFNMPTSTVTGTASSTIDTDDSDPLDNNGSLAAAKVTTTTNQNPTAQAVSATVSANTAVFTALPAMTGTDPDNDVLSYVIDGSSIGNISFGTVYYTRNGVQTTLSGTTSVTLTAAEVATLQFKAKTGAALNNQGVLRYSVIDNYGGGSGLVNYTITVGDQPASYPTTNVYYTTATFTGLTLPTDPDGTITGATRISGTLPTNLFLATATGNVGGGGANALNVKAGQFYIPKNLTVAAGTYSFTVTTTGAGTSTAIPVTLKFIAADNEATYSTSNSFNRDALTNGATLATVTDPDAPVTAASTTATLAPGLTLDTSTGKFIVNSDTPPFAGTYTYSVSTTDAAGGTSAPTATITIFDDTEAIYSSVAAKTGPYANNFTLATVTDGNGAINNATLYSGSMPPGVGLNATTGEYYVLDRTLLRTGTYTVTTRTTDVTGGITIQNTTINIGPSPLPVTLVAFTAQAAGTDAKLAWQTAQELNNDHFTLERSVAGGEFVAIGTVKGNGSSTQAHNYSFLDASVGTKHAGVVYYRLRQVDADGTSSLSPVRVLTFTAQVAEKLGVYPNPATDQTVVDLTALAAGTYQVTVLDVMGHLISSGNYTAGASYKLDMPQAPRGTYVVLVRGQGVKLTKTLVKE